MAEGKTFESHLPDRRYPGFRKHGAKLGRQPRASLSALYARAREVGYHKMADDILDIADAEETDPGQVARDRLRVETRKWKLSKALPKIYGDKLELNGSLEIRTHEDRLREIEAMNASLPSATTGDE